MVVNAVRKLKVELPTYDSEQSMVSTKLDLGMELDEDDFKVIFRDASKFHESHDRDQTVNYIKVKYGKLDSEIIDELLTSL
jgi:hypothetical protein